MEVIILVHISMRMLPLNTLVGYLPASAMDEQLVIIIDGQVTTTSLLVAEYFGKSHYHVLEKIRLIILTAENSAVNVHFQESTYVNEQGKSQPMYLLTSTGYIWLVMNFSGKKHKNSGSFQLYYLQNWIVINFGSIHDF